MKQINVYKIVLGLAAASLLVALFMFATGNIEQAGPFLIAFFVALAVGFLGFPLLKGFSYTVVIFAAVTASLYYPEYFVEINGFNLGVLIVPLIQIIMFGMGTSMSIKDFAGVVKMPKGVFVGVLCQLTIMPFIGFGLASLTDFPPEIAAGIILIGCSPSGMASNVMCYLAKANLALSITVTSVATLLAPLTTPLLMGWLAGAFVEIQILDMMWSIVQMVIFPVGAGLIFNKILSGKAKWLDKIMPLVSMFGIALIITIITASGRDSLLEIGGILILVVTVHNLLGYSLGYWASRLFRMTEQNCRTIAIEVGMQNGGLASGIAREMGKIATVGLAPAVFGPLMNVTGSILASYWHRKPLDGEGEKDTRDLKDLGKDDDVVKDLAKANT